MKHIFIKVEKNPNKPSLMLLEGTKIIKIKAPDYFSIGCFYDDYT